MDTETLAVRNRINTELLQMERYNTRMEYIRRIFNYDKFIGHDLKALQKNRLWYNHQFDHLMEMNLWDLKELDKEMHLICEQYGKVITRYGQE